MVSHSLCTSAISAYLTCHILSQRPRFPKVSNSTTNSATNGAHMVCASTPELFPSVQMKAIDFASV